MATQASIEAVQKMYIAYYGRPADLGGLNAWAEELDAVNGDMSAIVEAFGTSAEATARFGGQSSAETITTLYQQLFGRAPESDDILNAWVDQLENNPAVTLQSIALDLLSGAQNDDAAAIANKLTIAQAFTAAMDTTEEQTAYAGDAAITAGTTLLDTVSATTDTATVDVDAALAALVDTNPNPGAGAGTTFTLTEDQDMGADFTGTDKDDQFSAYVFDNQNTLQSGDILDGGAGRDTLTAVVGNSQNFAITPITSNIEVVELRAQASAFDAADNEVVDRGIDNNTQIDAQEMKNVDEWWTVDSRANLVIEDIRIDDADITKDITIGVRNTDAGDVNYEVYFDQPSLRPAPEVAEGAQLNIRLMDLKNAADGEPLKEDPYVGFHFQLDGVRVDVQADAIKDAMTYDELLVAVEAAVNATAGLENFTVAKTGTFTRADADGVQHQGDVITLTNNGSGVVTEGGWLIGADGVPGDSNLVAEQDNTSPDLTDFLVTSTVILDNVGRGSKSGDVVIGGMSQSDYSGSKGVEQFDIEVQNSSWLANMRSTNNTLEEVYVENDAGFSGDLRLDGDANAAAVGQDMAAADTYGLSDVRVFNADDMAGAVTLTAEIAATSVAKYLELTDDAANASADNSNFVYTMGNADDALTLAVSEEVAAHEDFSLAISTGTGSDTVTVDLVNDAANNLDVNWLADQGMLNNYSITTGSGDDVVNTLGQGEATISTGTGNDDVFTDNTGAATAAFTKADTAAFVFNAQNTDLTDLLGNGVTSALLHKASLQVEFAGFESTVVIPTADLMGDNRSINQAMKDAINNDRVLSSLLSAKDGANNTLVVEADVDGVFDTNDISVSITAVDYDNLTQAEIDQITTSLRTGNSDLVVNQTVIETALTNGVTAIVGAYTAEQQADARTGTVSTDISSNVVNVGSGDDVLVLGTGTGADDVVFTGYNNDKVSILHFNSTEDTLNFSAYLDTKVSASGSTGSQVQAGGVANNTLALTFTNTATQAADGETFAKLDAAALLSALKDNDQDFGNLDANSGSTITGTKVTDLVGSDRDHIVEVANSANTGEFKYFHVISTENADGTVEFSSANLISTVDFGTYSGNAGGGVVVPPAAGTVVPDATTGVADATAAADTISFSDANLNDGQFVVNNFDVANDTLSLAGLTGADGTTLADLAGDTIDTGVIGVQVNQIAGSTFVNLGIDANGDVISIELNGVTDPALVDIALV